MTPIEAKLKAVRDWATPEDVKGIRSFLGFANYYNNGSYKTLQLSRTP